jgi:hypothetical protein
MRCLEIIHLRPMQAVASAVLAHVDSLQADLATTPGLIEVHVYTETGLGFDVAVHLKWGEAGKTPLGTAVAESLRAFGLVDHSTWKEETP